MAKKRIKKTTQKTSKKSLKVPKPKKSYTWMMPVLGVIIIAAVLFFNRGHFDEKVITGEGKIVGYLNNNAIYQSEVQAQFELLPPELSGLMDEKTLLSQMIDEKILLSKSEELGLTASSEEVEAEINNILAQNGLTAEQLDQNLQAQGVSLKILKEMFGKQISINKLLTQEAFSRIKISEADLQMFYAANLDQFQTGEQVKARHILVQYGDMSEEETLLAMNAIEKLLTEDDSNFCELVTEYSEDPGSISTCGEYTFPRGMMVKEFEEAAFTQEVGEKTVVKTQFGYHLVQTLEKLSAETVPLEAASEQIREILVVQEQQTVFALYVEELKAENEIVNCYATPEVDLCIEEETQVEDLDEVEEEVEEDETIVNEIELEDETIEVETTIEISGETKTDSTMDLFAKCLTEKNTKLYGTFWSSQSTTQKEMFGDSLQYLNYVECSIEGNTRDQTDTCRDANISGYPTWEINGRKYPGPQTLEKIAQLSGCTL